MLKRHSFWMLPEANLPKCKSLKLTACKSLIFIHLPPKNIAVIMCQNKPKTESLSLKLQFTLLSFYQHALKQSNCKLVFNVFILSTRLKKWIDVIRAVSPPWGWSTRNSFVFMQACCFTAQNVVKHWFWSISNCRF